jgi:4-amino-4-deoxy-L-arabinose transferase-like glycosyltransferase
LAAVDLLDGQRNTGAQAVHGARLAGAVVGTVVVALVGLVALEALGPVVALIALAIAAVYPVLIELSALLVAENLLTAFALAAVWAGLRARHAQRPLAWLAGAGASTGLAALAHENGAVLLLPLAVAAWSATGRSVKGPAALIAAAILTVAPWTIRNAIVMHDFIPVSDETGITLAGTYNAISASDHRLPYGWRLYIPVKHTRRLTEPELGSRLVRRALSYVGDHPVAPLEVAYRNTVRMLELGGSTAWRTSAGSIDLPIATARIGVITFWLLCLLALAGAVTRPVRGAPRWLWLVPVLLVLSIVFVNAETPRFREPIDPFLILPAACAVSLLVARLRGAPVRRVRRSPLAARGTQLVEVRERLA